MKTLLRAVIFLVCVVSGVLVMCHPFYVFMNTGGLDITRVLIHVAVGFGLVFAGAELNDWLKERWKQRGR